MLSPCYDSLANVAEYLGCHVIRWSLVETTIGRPPCGWQLDLDLLQQLITPRTRLVVANFPHNPTGYLPAAAEWETCVQIVSKSGAWLFSGRDLSRPGARRASAPAFRLRPVRAGHYPGGLSKTYGLPGLRAGWLALPDRPLRDRLLGWKDYTTICASALAETLARIAPR